MVVWNMNAGPFRSGQWYRSKQEALQPSKAILPDLAERNNLPCFDAEDEEEVYRTCFCQMRSFREDGLASSCDGVGSSKSVTSIGRRCRA